jgi:hypothetical protein
MLGFDKFMWVVPVPTMFFIALYVISVNNNLSVAQRSVGILAAGLIALVLYPALVSRLVKTSRLWRS